MAVGVPEHEVFAAADAVLARGERPTVERVRLELGRGSPARVGGLLDQWWARLALRLNGETRLPTLPGEVSQAFVAVWQQAIHLAQGVVEQSLAEQRQVLDAERERMAVLEDQARQDMAKARQQVVEGRRGVRPLNCVWLTWNCCCPNVRRRSMICNINEKVWRMIAARLSSTAKHCSRNCKRCDSRPSRSVSRKRPMCAALRIGLTARLIARGRRASRL